MSILRKISLLTKIAFQTPDFARYRLRTAPFSSHYAPNVKLGTFLIFSERVEKVRVEIRLDGSNACDTDPIEHVYKIGDKEKKQANRFEPSTSSLGNDILQLSD